LIILAILKTVYLRVWDFDYDQKSVKLFL